MNTKAILIGGVLAALSGTALAENGGAFYLGVKGGIMMIDDSEEYGISFSDPSAAGFMAGYDFGSGLALEFEINSSGSADVLVDNFRVGEAEIDTQAIYMAFRSQGTGYFKARIGFLNEDVSVSSDTTCSYYGLCQSAEESDSGLSLGLGGGFNFGKMAQIEAEYTLIEEDVSYFSAGINLRF